MHEMSIIAGVLDSVEPSARQAGADRVLKISLRIGDMTEVVDEALEFAFDVLTEGTICEGAELVVTKVHPRSVCFECGEEFDHDRFHRSCPSCGSFQTQTLQGKELEIESIEVDIPDDEDDDVLSGEDSILGEENDISSEENGVSNKDDIPEKDGISDREEN